MSDLEDERTAMRSLTEELTAGTIDHVEAAYALATRFERIDSELRGGTRRPPQSMCGKSYTLKPERGDEPEVIHCGLHPGHAGPFHIGLFWWYTDPGPSGDSRAEPPTHPRHPELPAAPQE